MMNRKIGQLFRLSIYVLVLVALATFLVKLGSKPWILALGHWPTLLVIMITTGIGIIVQAASFRKSYPVGNIPLSLIETSRIWAASAVLSVIAPIFMGLATRTTLLINAGTSFSTCMLASTRQFWMGLEYAALFGGVGMYFIHLHFANYFSLALLLLWVMMIGFRITASNKKALYDGSILDMKFIRSLRSAYPSSAHIWFMLQLVVMSIVYYAAFKGVGASLHWVDAITLSSITVFISLIAFVPNGLGLTDVLWVTVAIQTGLTLEASVSLAILIRLGHFLSSVVLFSLLYFLSERQLSSV